MVVSATARPVCHLEFIQKTDFGGRLMGKFNSSLDFTTRQLDAKTKDGGGGQNCQSSVVPPTWSEDCPKQISSLASSHSVKKPTVSPAVWP